MKIGNIELKTLCRLAPMAGISNIPYRLICKELGSSLTTSEEISSSGLVYNHQRTIDIADYLPEERPIAMQIVGAEPKQLAEAAKILQDRGADIIDLNMGCPVPKITKTGAGSALMREPENAALVLRTIRQAIHVPFTIKIRGGWDDSTINAPEIAHIAESEGVDAICVHPRTRSQQYSGMAPWQVIRRVVEAVKIPVTGNGDVKSYADAHRMRLETGCQSVMIGRGALGRPWVFDPEFETLSPEAKHAYKLKIIRRHFDLIEKYSTRPTFAEIQMKKHLAWYTNGMQGAAKARQAIFSLQGISVIRNFLEDYWAGSLHLTDETSNAAADAILSASSSTCSDIGISVSDSISAATTER